MRAFNRRLAPKEFLGIPIIAGLALVFALVALIFTMLLPWVLKIFTIAAMVLCIAIAIIVMYLGDDFPLRGVMLAARRERRCVTTDTWSHF